MNKQSIEIRANTYAVISYLEEVKDIAERRGSLPEFLECILKIRDGLEHGIETVYLDDSPAGTGNGLVSLKVGQPLLDLLATLRTLDRNL